MRLAAVGAGPLQGSLPISTEIAMNHNRLLPALTLTASALMLAACVSPRHSPYENVSGDEPGDMTVTNQGHYQGHYQGTESGVMVVNNQDAVINANVISAVSSVPGLRDSSLQVGTLDGIVTLRGMVDSRATAQRAVQAARQVPGVRSVNYDLQVM
jgi:hyperosmotically inducible protein